MKDRIEMANSFQKWADAELSAGLADVRAADESPRLVTAYPDDDK